MSTLLIKNAALVATFDQNMRRLENCDILVRGNRIAAEHRKRNKRTNYGTCKTLLQHLQQNGRQGLVFGRAGRPESGQLGQAKVQRAVTILPEKKTLERPAS